MSLRRWEVETFPLVLMACQYGICGLEESTAEAWSLAFSKFWNWHLLGWCRCVNA